MSVPPDALSFQEAQPGRGPMRLTTINGRWDLWLPEHRVAQWDRWGGRWEPERVEATATVAGPGDLVFDVGAEEGDMPALWALWGARVVMVEPDPRVWPNIRATFDANGLAGHVDGWFVGFCGDQLRLRPDWDADHVDPAAGGWPACAAGPVVGDHGFLVLPERPDCPATTVDLLARHHGPPTVLTVDVEGAELRVLRGAERVLAEHRPAVLVSVHPQFMLDTYGDLASGLHRHLAERGYVPELLAVDHEEHWLFVHPDGRHP